MAQEPMSSPRMRRPSASSERSTRPVTSSVGADGRIVLTPTELHDGNGSYGHLSSPPYGSISQSQPQHTNASNLHHISPFRKRSLRDLIVSPSAAKVLYALCLLAAVGARASLVSLYYLLVLCYGVVQSFQSRRVTLLTIVVSFVACVCHIAIKLAYGDESRYNGAEIAHLFGFYTMRTTKTYVETIGEDVFVLGCSILYYWHLLRTQRGRFREQEPLVQSHLDFFEIGDHFLNGNEFKRDRPQSMLRVLELLSSVLLALTSIAVPAVASGLLYVVFLIQLIRYTVFVRRMTMEELLARESEVKRSSSFLGPEITKLVVALSVVILIAWYCIHLDLLAQNDIVQKIALYAGFANFRNGDVRWQYYFFAVFLGLLAWTSAKLHQLYTKVNGTGTLSSRLSNDGITAVELGTVDADVAQLLLDQRTSLKTRDIKELLKTQSIVVRAFARDGGLLLGSAAAVVWCVSYPSYLSAPLLALAFVTIALFGVLSSSVVMWFLMAYGILLALAEYTSNLTINFWSEDYTTYGLRVFDYPFLDIGAHLLCLVFMFVAIRTQWRYQDVLRESRKRCATAGDDEVKYNDDESVDRASFATIKRLAMMRSQMELGWRSAAQLWLVDAKQVIVSHLDALVLVTIIIVALSTHVSFFQIGYLLLAVSLMVFYEQRRRFWRYLLLYALGACFAVFVHNIECTESVELELIGLQCYHYKLKTWGSLWPTLFSAQLLIIAQLVFQLVIYVANREEIQERLRTKDHVGQNPVFFISRLAMEIDNCFRIGGAVLCYLAFIVVAIQFESGSTRLSTNLVGAVHLSLFFIIFGNQLSGFHLAPRTSLRLKVLWSLALFIEGSILIARHVYQFDKVATYLDTHLFTLSFISAQDMGFEYHASTSGISNVFIYLLPTAILTGLCLWQLSSMMKDVKPYNFFLRGRSRTADRFRFILESIQQVVISCSATALVLVTMVNALNPMSFVGFVYVVILIVGRALSDSWKQLWLPLFWLASLSALMKYVIQLSAFNSEQAEVGSLSQSNEDSPWIGTIRLVERFYEREGKSKLWELLSGDFWVIVLCCVQRIAQYFDTSSSTRRQSELNEIMRRFEEQYALFAATNSNHLYPTSSCEVDDNDDDVKERVRALQDDDNGASSGKKTVTGGEEQTDSRNDEAQRSSYTSEKRDFLISLQKFGAIYASKASVNVVMLMLTVSSFVHQDVLAIIYLIIVYSIMDASPTIVCRRWWALAWLLSCVILVMYLMMLWLPPFLDCKREETFPWRVVPDEYEKWLIMSHQHKWGLMTDFVALLSVYLLRNTNQNDLKVETIAAVDDSAAAFSLTFHNENSEDKSEQSMPTSHTEVMYALLMQQNVWYYLEFFVLAYWLPLLLLLVFVCGANQGGVVSMVYLFASLVMLYRLDEARRPSNLWIHYLRTWTWAHLFIITIINAPYVYAALSNCLVGDKAANDEHCMSLANFLGVEARKVPYGLITLFVLISIQCEIVAAPIYATVYAIIISEHKRAVKRREEIMREFYRQRTEQWYAMKKDKNAAIQRLKIIVYRLVHKVEELMDIARGLHHNLPPMAPSKPIIVETSQNAVLISWEKPSNSYHKIRQYRISRQQFPSLTLLGDFSDIVEISGERLEARIEGLRPGTSYQFKVCAVSRMGEGPFSAASDPIATYSLNLDGITTAGWMKYYREKLPASRWGFLVSWMNAKYLHRYVVIDSSHLVFYQDEERALKHRSRKQKKRLKTSLKWSDVLSLKLSTSKVQYDDVSPSLYCFELIVRHSSNRGDVKYVFQSEHSKEFNLFLSALAFAVPREALGDNIIECLKERQLPSPLYITPLRRNTVEDSTFDEIKSEWSSVTGDESTLGDPEDDDFDAKNDFAWRIPLYRLLYCYQNAGFKLETVEFEEDDMNEPSCLELMQLFIHVIRSKSASICCLVLILCFTEQADLLNMVYVLATFTFLLVENPRPIPTIWTRLLAYTCGIIALRYVFQLSIFCTGMTDHGSFYPSLEPYCMDPLNAAMNAKSIQFMVLFGVYKFDGTAIDHVNSVFDGLQWNFYVMIVLLWHQRELRLQGFWIEEAIDDSNQASSQYKADVMRGLQSSLSSSHDSIDDALLSDGRRQAPIIDQIATSSSSRKIETANLCNEIAAQVLQELNEQERLEEIQKEALGGITNKDNLAHSVSSRQSLENERSRESVLSEYPQAARNDVVAKLVHMSGDMSEYGYYTGAKTSWLETTFPRAYSYFQTVICDPPAQWDKDIYVAITGAKPGRDFYTASLSVLLFSAIYAVVLYEQLGEADASSTSVADANSRISSSSLLSGYLVLLVFVELVYIIWDRVAYVTSSLRSKVLLQYSYTIGLHLTVWILLPSNTNIYFQQRPALVVFYLFQCVYLWLGALQIRYGYLAYLGSRYNYTKENKVTALGATLFGVMMKAPFLFEMRALLDYICTTTSLSWQHWVLLEDTAAHLFSIQNAMKERLENAEILQGKQRQPIQAKLTSAGVMLLFLLVCLVGPLAMFSSINPSTTTNDVTYTLVTFGLVDEHETMYELYTNSDRNSPSCQVDLNTNSASVQCIEFHTFSNDVYSISPPRTNLLVTQLQSTQALNWTITFAFTRPGPKSAETISATYAVTITDNHRQALVPILTELTTSSLDTENVSLIHIESLYPAVVQLTASRGVLQRSTGMQSVTITKHALKGSTWWSMKPDVNSSDASSYCSSTYPFCIVAVSDKIVQGLTTLGISSYGIMAVYIFVVVTVGSAVKGFFRGKVYHIQYEELPDPDDVLELVEGIYIARKEQYVGHLKDEVRLFESLVRMLRSPETLLKVTGTNVIHIPTAKEKLD